MAELVLQQQLVEAAKERSNIAKALLAIQDTLDKMRPAISLMESVLDKLEPAVTTTDAPAKAPPIGVLDTNPSTAAMEGSDLPGPMATTVGLPAVTIPDAILDIGIDEAMPHVTSSSTVAFEEAVQVVLSATSSCLTMLPTTCSTGCPSHDASASVLALASSAAPTSSTITNDVIPKLAAPLADGSDRAVLTLTTCSVNGLSLDVCTHPSAFKPDMTPSNKTHGRMLRPAPWPSFDCPSRAGHPMKPCSSMEGMLGKLPTVQRHEDFNGYYASLVLHWKSFSEDHLRQWRPPSRENYLECRVGQEDSRNQYEFGDCIGDKEGNDSRISETNWVATDTVTGLLKISVVKLSRAMLSVSRSTGQLYEDLKCYVVGSVVHMSRSVDEKYLPVHTALGSSRCELFSTGQPWRCWQGEFHIELPSRAGLTLCECLNNDGFSEVAETVTGGSNQGMIIGCSSVIPELKEAVFHRLACGFHSGPVMADRGGVIEPHICEKEQYKASNSVTIWHLCYRTADKPIIKLQGTPDQRPEGGTFPTVRVLMHDKLVDSGRPGDKVEITGIYMAICLRIGPTQRTVKSIFNTYIDCLHIKNTNKSRLHLEDSMHTDNTNASMSSEDVNILLVGDPGTNKPQLLQYIHKLSPHGIYTSGRINSEVGLAVFVAKDPETDETVLKRALVLSANGVFCIEVFDKLFDNAQNMLHEPMEQQTASIAKAGTIGLLRFFCDKCSSLQATQKRMKVKKLANILVFHLKQFKYIKQIGRCKKLSYHVVLPLELKLIDIVDWSDLEYSFFVGPVHVAVMKVSFCKASISSCFDGSSSPCGFEPLQWKIAWTPSWESFAVSRGASDCISFYSTNACSSHAWAKHSHCRSIVDRPSGTFLAEVTAAMHIIPYQIPLPVKTSGFSVRLARGRAKIHRKRIIRGQAQRFYGCLVLANTYPKIMVDCFAIGRTSLFGEQSFKKGGVSCLWPSSSIKPAPTTSITLSSIKSVPTTSTPMTSESPSSFKSTSTMATFVKATTTNLTVPWDPGKNSSAPAWGQAEFQGGRNVTGTIAAGSKTGASPTTTQPKRDRRPNSHYAGPTWSK